MSHKKLDLDFFETIIVYNALKNDVYLSSIIDHLKPEYFTSKDIASVLGIITSYYTERNTVPTITELKARLNTKELKNALISVANSFKTLDTTYNIDELLSNTEFFLKQKAVYNAVLSSAESFGKNKVDPAATLATFEAACNISLIQDYGLDLINDIDGFIDKISKPVSTMSTGYSWLDKMLNGGFTTDGKALYIISAPTNVGKSIMLANLACNIARQNKKVVIFTLEMSEEMYGRRIASCLTKLPINELNVNSSMLRDDINQFRDDNSRSSIKIKEYPTKGATVNTLKAYIKKLYDTMRFKPDLIVVDYLNLLNPIINTGSTYTDTKQVSEQLRGMSYMLGGIPVLSATQLNRSAFDQINPGLETTSDSMGTAMTADMQLSLWANEEDKELGLLHAGMQKNRFGPNFGRTTFDIDWMTLRIDEQTDTVFSGTDINGAKSILDSL